VLITHNTLFNILLLKVTLHAQEITGGQQSGFDEITGGQQSGFDEIGQILIIRVSNGLIICVRQILEKKWK
jgi:hypothetical protein